MALPLALGIVTAVAFYSVLSSRSQTPPLAEIGVWFVAAVTVYMVLPLAIYLLLGEEYTPINDSRLWLLQPEPAQVARIAWLYLAFLGAFALVYLRVRGYSEPQPSHSSVAKRQTVEVMLGLWILLTLFSFAVIPKLAADGYAAGYAASAALPLGLRQVVRLWAGWNVILTLGMRVWLFQNFSRTKWIVFAWLTYDLVLAFTSLGSRTSIVLSLGSSFLLYHLLVHPIRVKAAILFGTMGLVGFLLLGIYRMQIGQDASVQLGPAIVGGEFEGVFANAVDLQARASTGEIGALPVGFHFADILSILPSQILPFDKPDPAAWYVSSFFPEFAEKGYAMAFGVISQGIVGLGLLEVILRGSILGFAFAKLHRWFSSRSNHLWVLMFYVWATLWAYQSFRDQSFILASSALQQFVPLALIVEGFRRILGRQSLRGPSMHPAGAVSQGTELG